jgi:uncharacterized phiE125 gp8 family phage protein
MQTYKILSVIGQNIVTLQDIKKYLRLNYDDEDDILKDYILASIEFAEKFINIALQVKLIELNFDPSPRVEFPILPLINVEKVTMRQSDVEIELNNSWSISDDGRHLILEQNCSSKYKVIYKAGFAEAKLVPSAIRQGIICHVAQMYDKQIISNDFMVEIHQFYKPFRKILV